MNANTKLKDVSIFFSNCYIFFLKVLFIKIIILILKTIKNKAHENNRI